MRTLRQKKARTVVPSPAVRHLMVWSTAMLSLYLHHQPEHLRSLRSIPQQLHSVGEASAGD